MPGVLNVIDSKPVMLSPDKGHRRRLDIRNESAANGGKRVWYAFQKDFAAEAAAYLEPGEGIPVIGHSADAGVPMWFLTSSGDTSTVYWS